MSPLSWRSPGRTRRPRSRGPAAGTVSDERDATDTLTIHDDGTCDLDVYRLDAESAVRALAALNGRLAG